MRRRAVLRAALGLAGLASAGVVGPAAGSRGTDIDRAYAPLGRVGLDGTTDCRVSADGETAYVAVDDGFAVVDIIDLTTVATVRTVADDHDDGPLSGIQDLAVDGDRLLVPGPANPRPGHLAGFALYDVTDPVAPEPVAFHETSFPIHNAALADGRAYLTAGLSLVVVDVRRDEPTVVGRWSPADADSRWAEVPPSLRVLHDVRLRGDLAVCSLWDAGTWLVDVGDPAEASVVGRAGGRPVEELAAVGEDDVRRQAIAHPGNHHSAALSADGTRLAVGAEAFDLPDGDGAGGPGGIALYDVADPSSPTPLATIDAPAAADETRAGTWTTAHDFAFAGDRLVSAWYQGGVRIHDVSTPAEPAELAWWRRPAEAAFWTARPAADGTFVAPSTSLPNGELFEGLYRFPNRPGVQADPPMLTRPSPTDTATSSPSPRPTVSPTSNQTATPGQPGFGVGSVLGGLAGATAWQWWRERGP